MDDTKRDIFEATRELLLEQGYDAFTIQAVADRAGLTDAGVHYHFETKEQLLGMWVEYECKHVEENFPEDDPPDERLAAMLSDRFQAAEELATIEAAPPSMQLLVANVDPSSSIRETLHSYREMIIEQLTETIREGVERGVFETDRPEQTARVLTAMISGAESRAGVGESPEPLATATEERVLSELCVDDPPTIEWRTEPTGTTP